MAKKINKKINSLKAKFACCRNIRQNRRLLLFSMAHALFLLLPACYFLWNMSHTFSGEFSKIKYFNIFKQVTSNTDSIPDDVLLVNVAYDRGLVDYYEKLPNDTSYARAGNTDITDRKKLLELFEYLAKDTSYQFIVCDVFFDALLTTKYDSALFNLMQQMPRLVIPMHEKGNTLPAQLVQKAAYSDYKVNIKQGSLLKYQYLQHGKKSIPLLMWEELGEQRKLNKHCFWYTIDGRLVTNSVILDFQTKFQDKYNANGDYNYINLGVDLLEPLQEGLIMPNDRFKSP
jgi:hypothetical protein